MEPDCVTLVFTYQFRSSMVTCKETTLCQQTKSLHIKLFSLFVGAQTQLRAVNLRKTVLLFLMIINKTFTRPNIFSGLFRQHYNATWGGCRSEG